MYKYLAIRGSVTKRCRVIPHVRHTLMGYLCCCRFIGSSGASTQLFKFVETDLVSKELSRYDSSDAQPLGLHSIQDVLSDLANARSALRAPDSVAATTSAPSASVETEDAPVTQESGFTATTRLREEEVLAAWGHGPCLVGSDVRVVVNLVPLSDEGVKKVEELVAPAAGGEEVGVGEGEGETKMAIKRTYQPSTLKRKRMHGFLYRSKSRLGKKILRRRQAKGRWRLGI